MQACRCADMLVWLTVFDTPLLRAQLYIRDGVPPRLPAQRADGRVAAADARSVFYWAYEELGVFHCWTGSSGRVRQSGLMSTETCSQVNIFPFVRLG